MGKWSPEALQKFRRNMRDKAIKRRLLKEQGLDKEPDFSQGVEVKRLERVSVRVGEVEVTITGKFNRVIADKKQETVVIS